MLLPLILVVALSVVIAIDDGSFLGGVRPFDGGDDGLFYDGVARSFCRKFLAGDIVGVLQGGENVFYYGGPGLRYFRAFEHIVFGESYLGYLSLLLLPFLDCCIIPPLSAGSMGARADFSFRRHSQSARCSAPALSTT